MLLQNGERTPVRRRNGEKIPVLLQNVSIPAGCLMSADVFDYAHWLRSLSEASFGSLVEAAEAAISIHQSLANDGASVISEWLSAQDGQPIEIWRHYPADDCRDPDSGSMVYYHAHDPEEWQRDEHGHFHLFVRPGAADDFSHAVAISMSAQGVPSAIFATNVWVTDENLVPAAEVLRMLDTNWMINRVRPSWLVLGWLDAFLILTRPWIERLLLLRDREIGWIGERKPTPGVLEDRDTHILSELSIDWAAVLKSVQVEARTRMCRSISGAAVSC